MEDLLKQPEKGSKVDVEMKVAQAQGQAQVPAPRGKLQASFLQIRLLWLQAPSQLQRPDPPRQIQLCSPFSLPFGPLRRSSCRLSPLTCISQEPADVAL
eukprot:scaffold78224_cov19-Tisochrysis_lutea.AAC.4